jgi:periplasmic protein TonB
MRWEALTVTRNALSTVENYELIGSSRGSGREPVTLGPVASGADVSVLFQDSLLDSGVAQQKRRVWPTLLSFVLQFFMLGFAVFLPLWFTEMLPKEQMVTFLEAPPPPPPPLPAASTPPAAKTVKITSNIANGQLRTPSRIPKRVQMLKEDDEPPLVATTSGVVGGVPGGIPGGQLGGVIGGIISSAPSPAIVPALPKPVPTVQRVRVSAGVTDGLLIHRVEPIYPPVAQQAHIQGAVVLAALIDKGGNVQSLQVVSGPPLLVRAAIDAVKQWRYQPLLVNGQPIEVETTVTVNFHVRSD